MNTLPVKTAARAATLYELRRRMRESGASDDDLEALELLIDEMPGKAEELLAELAQADRRSVRRTTEAR